MIFAPTELKVRARVNTLNVTWHPSPNHTLVSGYKLSCREVEADEATNGERTTQTHTIRLRKKARYHLLTGLGKLFTEASPNVVCVLLSYFHGHFSVFAFSYLGLNNKSNDAHFALEKNVC